MSEGKPALQALLIPLGFDLSEEEGARVSVRLDEFAEMGIRMKKKGACTFEILSLSEDFSALPESDLIELVKGSLEAGEEWRRDIRAGAACRLAIKEGDPVDQATAAELLRGALALENPRCPHGRPIWHEIHKSDLYALVDRTF
jgi:DNA mismatch repair protein MutL